MLEVASIKGDPNLCGLWYLSMRGCGRADKVFYAGPHDLESVLSWIKLTNVFYGAFKDNQLIGVGFVENIQTFHSKVGVITRGEMGFGFLPNCTVFDALQAGRIMVNYCFEDGIDHLFGTTPELNKEALMYAKRLGFDLYGPVPNSCFYLGDYIGQYTSHISKEKWNAGRKNQTS